jgi:hypothetical protein
MKYLKRINEFNENEFEREDEFRLGHDEQEGDENLYDDEDFYSTHDEEEGDEDFRFSDDEEDEYSLEGDEDEYSLEDEDEFSNEEDEESRNWGDEETKLERISSFNSFNEKMNPGFKAYLDKQAAKKAGKKAPAKKGGKEEEEEGMPDFPDVDKDGNKKESIKKVPLRGRIAKTQSKK